jgi:hypothetical protein
MAWTAPKTWAGDLLATSDFNLHIRDNLLWLKSPTSVSVTLANAITTTSTSWADATGLSVTMTTNGGNVLVIFTAATKHSADGSTWVDLDVDGASQGGTDGIMFRTGTGLRNVSFSWVVEGLSAASHTFKIRWKVSAGTATMVADDSSSGEKMKPFLYVVEAL